MYKCSMKKRKHRVLIYSYIEIICRVRSSQCVTPVKTSTAVFPDCANSYKALLIHEKSSGVSLVIAYANWLKEP